MEQKQGPKFGDFQKPSKQQRKNARIRINNLIGSFTLNNQSRENECRILDIGTGGLGIETKTLLYPGDKIIIRFWLEENNFELPCVVSRVSGKNAGVVFENISEEIIAKIQNYIHKNFFHSKK